jgi:Transcription factor zinc-finger
MADQKDRFGERLHDAEAARENQWAKQRDAELLGKMREKMAANLACPHCQHALEAQVKNGIEFYACPSGHGAWLEHATIERLTEPKK